MFWLSQGFALPLKCPEFPACGLSANAAAAPPNDMVSANISAVINNEMRFLIFSHPLSLTRVLNTIGPKRDAWRVGAHTEAPPLSLCVWGWGSLFRAFSIVTPPPFGSPATSLIREVHGLCAPASRRVCLYRGAGAPERTLWIVLTRRCLMHLPDGHLSQASWSSLYAGWLSSRGTSENAVQAKFAGFLF